MPRGMKPAATAGQWDTGAGHGLTEPVQPPAQVEPPAETSPSRRGAKATVRQTIDLPRDTHRRLHYRAGAIADNLEVNFKQVNAQTILRELVTRYLDDEELQRSVDAAIRRPFS